MKLTFVALSLSLANADPLACQPNAEQPMLPTYHIIGNVTKKQDGSIKLEPINDCSGVTYYEGLYHVWHQCCQNHWDHMISKDLIHWQRLPPPVQPLNLKTWDGSVSMLPKEDGGPLMLYDAQDGKHQLGSGDRPILGVARLADINDKYLLKWARAENNPVEFRGDPIAFPGQVWKNGDHWNFIGQGARFQSNDSTFHTWTRMNNMIGMREHGGQWWIPMPNAIDGSPPPAGFPNRLVNVAGGQRYLFGHYHLENETFTPWVPEGEKLGREAILEGGGADWWGGQMANGRMMIIGWAMPDYHGAAGPGIGFLTRLTLLREVNYDPKTQNLVSNPLPELKGLRNGRLASEKNIALKANAPYAIKGTEAGAASSADVTMTFLGIAGSEQRSFGACVLGNRSIEGLGIAITVSPATASVGRIASVHAGTCSETMFKQVLSSKKFKPVQLFDDEEVTLRITPDRSLADFFVQGGRWAGTIAWPSKTFAPRKPSDSEVTVWSTSSDVKANVDVDSMGCGWADPSYTEHPNMLDEELIV